MKRYHFGSGWESEDFYLCSEADEVIAEKDAEILMLRGQRPERPFDGDAAKVGLGEPPRCNGPHCCMQCEKTKAGFFFKDDIGDICEECYTGTQFY